MPEGSVWEFQGIFSSREKAVNACISENYFIFSCELDLEIPKEKVPMPETCYPFAEKGIMKGIIKGR